MHNELYLSFVTSLHSCCLHLQTREGETLALSEKHRGKIPLQFHKNWKPQCHLLFNCIGLYNCIIDIFAKNLSEILWELLGKHCVYKWERNFREKLHLRFYLGCLDWYLLIYIHNWLLFGHNLLCDPKNHLEIKQKNRWEMP